ncbi:hypothetical protein INT47_010893 [Mucor saturninus]|uniref:DDE Tnp4 domain-containing protein n=1 Tax=Mucor saturninus TaxID=64648 RepID=A0A8H7VB41_9FUNG|nr:hypothetical protein INT47_010893 [Mucor saturninus]
MSTFEESLNEFTTVYEESMTLINMNVATIQWYMEQLQLEINLLHEDFLFYFSSVFDGPSFFHALPFLLTDTRSTRVRPNNNGTFSNYHYWTTNCHIGYRTSNMAFGVSHGSYINFFRRFLAAIERVYGDLINWPMDQQRVEEIQTSFEWPHGQEEGAFRRFPKAIGALNGKNFVIECPRDYPENWRDRKGNFAIKLTAICDNKCRFTYIRVGDSGRTHDAGAFKWTEVYTQFLRQPATFFPLDGYILACYLYTDYKVNIEFTYTPSLDSAYALCRNVIVPCPLSEVSGNSDEAVAKRKFNKVHSSARMTIERAFGILSARWRFIKKHVYMKKIIDICQVITAACILHNFCINIGDPDFETDEGIEMDEDEEGNIETARESVRTRRDELNRWF